MYHVDLVSVQIGSQWLIKSGNIAFVSYCLNLSGLTHCNLL